MKKIVVFFITVTACYLVNAQTYWRLDGNSSLSSNSFIGSTDNKPLHMKTSSSDQGLHLWFSTLTLGSSCDSSYNLSIHSKRTLETYAGVTRDASAFRYINSVHLTTPFTGKTANDGFLIQQTNDSLVLRQCENANFALCNSATGIVLDSLGATTIGKSTHILTLGPTSWGNNTNMYIGFNIRKKNNSWYTIPSEVDNGGAVIFGTATGDLLFANFASRGIGAQNLSANTFKSHVNLILKADGTLQAKEVKVTIAASDWPDYVFDEGYTLRPLSETEQYIKDNGHLPDIPSAEDIENEGVALGEMNRLLLQKVEELTLQVIDLQKQINELKRK